MQNGNTEVLPTSCDDFFAIPVSRDFHYDLCFLLSNMYNVIMCLVYGILGGVCVILYNTAENSCHKIGGDTRPCQTWWENTD